jgi:putative transposase
MAHPAGANDRQMPTAFYVCPRHHRAMSNYRRAYRPGATWFFTVVTARRQPLLATTDAIHALRQSVAAVRRRLPFTIDAWVVLPDHMHAIWTLPEDDADFSQRWGRIKTGFTQHCGLAHRSGHKLGSGLWQPRFWEHLIRGDTDFATHMDYLHYNPVKHGWVDRVSDWPYSSFHRWMRRGVYTPDWGHALKPLSGAGFGE